MQKQEHQELVEVVQVAAVNAIIILVDLLPAEHLRQEEEQTLEEVQTQLVCQKVEMVFLVVLGEKIPVVPVEPQSNILEPETFHLTTQVILTN
jgi:hypothetical protein